MSHAIELNHRAAAAIAPLSRNPDLYRVRMSSLAGARLIDCGISAEGGIDAGLLLARACMADLGTIRITEQRLGQQRLPHVEVHTDHPTEACLLSQYAGWHLSADGFYGMGSGPMRLARCDEPLLQHLGCKPEPVPHAVGIVESGQLPPEDLVRDIAKTCGGDVTLLIAPTSSLAGTIQVVARSIETTLHKLRELDFDTATIVSGFGSAPLPRIGGDDLSGIGRTNDSILYGARVTLWLRGDDQQLELIGPKIPSSSSHAHGRSFLEIFKAANGDFYAIDKHLFSPAQVTLGNLSTGHSFMFGEVLPELAIS